MRLTHVPRSLTDSDQGLGAAQLYRGEGRHRGNLNESPVTQSSPSGDRRGGSANDASVGIQTTMVVPGRPREG